MAHWRKSRVTTVWQFLTPWLWSQFCTTFSVSCEGCARAATSSKLKYFPKIELKVSVNCVVSIFCYDRSSYRIAANQGRTLVSVTLSNDPHFAASAQMWAPLPPKVWPVLQGSSPWEYWKGGLNELSWTAWSNTNEYVFNAVNVSGKWSNKSEFGINGY